MIISSIQNFQIPVLDFHRAHKFYNQLMGYQLDVIETPQFKIGIFQFDQQKGTGGCIIHNTDLKPSRDGTMVYLHAGDNLQPFLDRAVKAGGKIFIGKTQLGPGMGFYGIIEDTEGNRVGLYSDN